MEYAAFVFISLLSTCAAAGGYAWQWGTEGQSCALKCSDVGLVCVEEFTKIGSQADFVAASDGSVSCTGGYRGTSQNMVPGAMTGGGPDNDCFWQTGSGGNCAEKPGSAVIRLCSCTCAAGSFSPSDTQPYPCTRYDKIPTLPSHLRLRKARPT